MTDEIEELEAEERHLFRFLVKLAVVVAVVYVAVRFLTDKKNEFADLTESEARDKLVEKMSSMVGDETANEIADQVVPKLKDRGLIKPDPAEDPADMVEDTAEDAPDAADDMVDEAGDQVGEAVDPVVKD